MTYFALVYDVVDDHINRRIPYRDDHLRAAREASERGELLLAGALGDPPDQSLLVFRAADATVAEAFARNDPYVRAGLVKAWTVRPMAVAVGGWPEVPRASTT